MGYFCSRSSGDCQRIQARPWDSGGADAVGLDAGATDASRRDAVSVDAAMTDAAQADMAQADTAFADAVLLDASHQDAQQFDARIADAEPADATPPDVMLVDVSLPDAMLADVALPDAALPDAARSDAAAADACACVVGAVDEEACGVCSVRSRSCDQDCQWQAWSPCPEEASPNLLLNPDFEDGEDGWGFQSVGQGYFTTTAPAQSGQAAARVHITLPGSNTQLFQTGFSLEEGARYRICLWAYSNSGRNMDILVHRHGSPYTNYGLGFTELDLGLDWQLFSVEFTAANFNNATSDTRLRFWFPPYDRAGDDYRIDNLLFFKLPD